MRKLDCFSELCRGQEELWEKEFFRGVDFSLAVFARTGEVAFKSVVNQTAFTHLPVTVGTTKFRYSWQTGNTTVKMLSSGSVCSAAELILPQEKSLVFRSYFLSNAKENLFYADISAEYMHKYHRSKVSLINSKHIQVNSVFGMEDQGLGIDVCYDCGNNKIEGTGIAVWKRNENWKAVGKYTNNRQITNRNGDMMASVFYSRNHVFEFGASAGIRDKKMFMQASTGINIEGRLVKARLDQNGLLGFAIRNKVHNCVTIVNAVQLELGKLNKPFSYGVKIKLNE
jgi:hypothetical protein